MMLDTFCALQWGSVKAAQMDEQDDKTTRRQMKPLCSQGVLFNPPELLVVLPNMPRYVDMWRALCFLNYGDSPQCPFISC